MKDVGLVLTTHSPMEIMRKFKRRLYIGLSTFRTKAKGKELSTTCQRQVRQN